VRVVTPLPVAAVLSPALQSVPPMKRRAPISALPKDHLACDSHMSNILFGEGSRA
jgi:hypothetical protein